MRRKLGIAAVVAFTALACGKVPGGATPIVSPPAEALVAWSGFPADQLPRPVVMVGNASAASGFTSSEAKIAAGCHKFRSGITLSKVVPAWAQVSWTTGTTATYPAISAAAALVAMMRPLADTSDPNCATAQTLVVNGSRLGLFDFQTDRGNAHISAWLFTASGVMGEVAYPALGPPALWNGGILNGYLNGGSTVSADGRTLSFTFWGAPLTSGPCGADYKGVLAESSSAVAVAVQAIPHASPGEPIACDAMAQQRSVTIALASPLGGRVVLDASGNAASVCPATKPDC